MNTESETYLACLDDSYKFEDEAKVANTVILEDGRTAVTLDRTIFYPQGGGQPADNGTIQSANGKFSVSDVRLIDGRVLHFGAFLEGSFADGEPVKVNISKDRRMLNARLHSAGHLIDVAVQKLGLDLKPGKGYHFPDGPYVEYEGKLELTDKDELSRKLQLEVFQLVSENLPIKVTLADDKNAEELCGELPSYLDKSKPIRVVRIGDNPGCPCGGTHLKELKDLGHMEISKIRTKAEKVKVSYILK
jgi:Ser-tRNA(Ala) deacylase AlaX